MDNSGGSTVHSWINADFVPSWLRPFTLDQNTRFTRTPDHLLRPREESEPQESALGESALGESGLGESGIGESGPWDSRPEDFSSAPLPSYGTAGSSWHFLEMPLDIQEEAPPLPSVRADIATLEQAFADLPALRAARDSAHGDETQDMSSFPQAEGWSVDESGRETVLSWNDSEPPMDPVEDTWDASAQAAQAPGDVFDSPLETSSAAPFAPPPPSSETLALGGDLSATAMGPQEPDAPILAQEHPTQETLAQETLALSTMDMTTADMTAMDTVPMEASPSLPAEGLSSEPLAALGDAGMGPVDTPFPGDKAAEGATTWSTGAEPAPPAAFEPQPMTAPPSFMDANFPPATGNGPIPDGMMAEAPMAAPAWDAVMAPDTSPMMASPQQPQQESWHQEAGIGAGDALPGTGFENAPLPPASTDETGMVQAPLANLQLPEATLPASSAAEAAFMEAPMAEVPTGFIATENSAFEPAAPLPPSTGPDGEETGVGHDFVVSQSATVGQDAIEPGGETSCDGNALTQPLPADAEPTASIADATMTGAPLSDAIPADGSLTPAPEAPVPEMGAMAATPAPSADDPDDAQGPSEMPDGTPLDGTLAQLAAAALEGASALLEDETPLADPPMEDFAPAHLRPLTRMIVVGRLCLPEILEQDLTPSEPAAPAPEAEAAARAADLINAHFAWQPYHLSINGELGAAPSDATSVDAAPVDTALSAPVEPATPAAPSLPALSNPPALPAVVDVVDPAHDPFAYHLPPIELLGEPPQLEPDYELSEEFLDQSSAMLQQILRDFGIRGEVIDANPGPVVTLYEFEPAPGVKSSRVIALAPDIARSMSAVSARVAVVEGRNVIGIELPNRRRDTVWLRELLASHEFEEARTKLGLCLGKTIGGVPVITDLARMPHLLVAGTTGSGKSVAINTMILSLLYRHTPDACRLIMIDPKMLELSIYEGIPHLLTPVVTDPKKAIIALKWAVKEMEDRYRKMARLAVRNIDGYNARMAEAREKGEVLTRQVQVGFDKESGEALYEEQQMDLSALPYIVIIVDEMADLMMVAGKEIEGAIQRLAQMARAAGIHLVMATQRPSVDVITGTIKANFPTRISFQVTSKIDSRTILGEMGAETLLGQGDMLFMAGGGRITRVHGPFVSDQEVEHVVGFLKAQGGPEYLEDVVQDEEAEGASGSDDAVFDKSEMGDGGGDLYEQAVAIVLRDRKASTSYIQRRLQVGYNKAASLMERMEAESIVGPANHAGKREILSFGRDHDDH